jgi:hypothetical protein
MKLLEEEKTFLRVRWEASEPGGEVCSYEATLCRYHREEIWRQHSSLMGCRQRGQLCDLCDGRTPTRI